MKIIEAMRIAMRALAANKLRSILTMLGIIIGVGAVIALMSIGRGVEKYVTDQFAGLGSNLLFIAPGQISDGPPTLRANPVKSLTLADMQAIGDPSLVPDVTDVAADFQTRATVGRNGKDVTVQASATTANYNTVRTWNTTEGTYFSQLDSDERQRVVLLGADTYAELFPNGEYPIDQIVQVNGMNFRVIGVMESKGGGPGGNLDKSIFMPLTTAQDRLFKQKNPNGEYKVTVIYASIDDADNIPLAQDEITQLMRERRGIKYLDQDDFSIISQNDLIAVFGDILGALTIFLGAIAAISLLVGGIGIMNIMLVSVTERTREIGLRKAVGAKRSDVLVQFLIEAMALAIVGGMIGVAMGWGLARAVSVLFGEFQAVVGADAVITSLVVATAVGLFFGIFPAYRASRLNPIDALRYE
ncbi:MAG: ABC transporter permease [Caldilinea sp.]|nr:ABC transporter permease [Caldilineaceae bacterium]MCO5211433.1 ABC transporter permease [Caldilinea sp.]MCW5842849.1 ABC transporter permease [Caldilinea sp.]HRW46565.1 ABC transporter permease [Caldilinea sp.]